MSGTGFRLAPHLAANGHGDVAAHDDPEHGGGFMLLIAALEEHDDTVKLTTHCALPLRNIHVSGGRIAGLETWRRCVVRVRISSIFQRPASKAGRCAAGRSCPRCPSPDNAPAT